MADMKNLSSSPRARKLLEEGQLASKRGDAINAEVIWKQALREASETVDTFDCGGMFLSSAHLAFLYQSWGWEYEILMQDAVQSALYAFHRAFHADKFISHAAVTTITVPAPVSRILNSLNELSPGCYQHFLSHKENEIIEEEEEEEDVEPEVKLVYTREEILDISRRMEPSSEDCTKKILVSLGYGSVDVVVDVHPDNLLQPNRKKGGGKNNSNAKKKKKKNDYNSNININDNSNNTNSIRSGSINSSSSSSIVTPGIELDIQERSTQQFNAAAVATVDTIEKEEGNISENYSRNSSGVIKNISSIRSTSTSPSPVYEMPPFNSAQALAWANALDTNVQAVLGGECVLLTDPSGRGEADSSTSMSMSAVDDSARENASASVGVGDDVL